VIVEFVEWNYHCYVYILFIILLSFMFNITYENQLTHKLMTFNTAAH